MNEIFGYVIKAVLATLAVKLLRLDTKRVVVSQSKPISWVWKTITPLGKFMFFFGLFIFIANLSVSGLEASNTLSGISISTLGLLFWIWGGLVIYLKRN